VKIGRCLYLVLDEADRMLDMGFEPQMREIAKYLPAEKQTALFTATWPKEVRQVAESMTTRDSVHIQVGSTDAQTTNADITQHIVKIRNESEKMRHLEEQIFPQLQTSGGAALIFTKTKRAAANMHSTLRNAGAPIVCLHGDMEQRERDSALWAFKQGKAKVLVATDVAQRGLDIKTVQIVVNYDPPANAEDYVHRIGRTGRAGNKGNAYTYLYENDAGPAMNIMKVMKKSGQTVPPELHQICQGQISNLTGQWGGRYAGGGGGGGSWG